MQEAYIDASALEQLIERLAQSPQVLSDAKRRAFEAAAPELKALLDSEIGGTGRVRSWQEAFAGSKGGFAKTRPKRNTFAEDRNNHPTKYAVAWVTNVLNNGRKTRKTFAQERGYSMGNGKHFYGATQDRAGSVAEEAAEEIVAALLEFLEGGLI